MITEGDSTTFTVVLNRGSSPVSSGVLVPPTSTDVYGNFSQVGADTYNLRVSWSEIEAVESIEFSSGGTRSFRALFFDAAGNSAEATVSLAFECAGANVGACGGACTDFGTPTDCGGCGDQCLAEYYTSGGVHEGNGYCEEGACACTGTDWTGEVIRTRPALCGNTCVDLDQSRDHCGDCSTSCTVAYSECVGGTCECPPHREVECAGRSEPPFQIATCGCEACGATESCRLFASTAIPRCATAGEGDYRLNRTFVQRYTAGRWICLPHGDSAVATAACAFVGGTWSGRTGGRAGIAMEEVCGASFAASMPYALTTDCALP